MFLETQGERRKFFCSCVYDIRSRIQIFALIPQPLPARADGTPRHQGCDGTAFRSHRHAVSISSGRRLDKLYKQALSGTSADRRTAVWDRKEDCDAGKRAGRRRQAGGKPGRAADRRTAIVLAFSRETLRRGGRRVTKPSRSPTRAVGGLRLQGAHAAGNVI